MISGCIVVECMPALWNNALIFSATTMRSHQPVWPHVHHIFVCPKPVFFQRYMKWFNIVFNDLRWKVIAKMWCTCGQTGWWDLMYLLNKNMQI
jgi:hypothetical protein